MLIKELLQLLEAKLRPYQDFDLNRDYDKELDGKPLCDAMYECFEHTGYRLKERYDDR